MSATRLATMSAGEGSSGRVTTDARARIAIWLAVAASLLIVVEAASDGSLLPWARAPLLMPFLVVATLLARPAPARPVLAWLVAAQVLSWFGDIALALPVDALFLVGVGFFLLAQVSYIVTFSRIHGDGLIRQRPWLLVFYAAYFLAMMAVVLPGADELAPALVIYGGVLLSMAAMAMNTWGKVDRRSGVLLLCGSILFVISDSLIAVTNFGPVPDNPAVATVLIGTYCVAQIMLAIGVLDGARWAASKSAGLPAGP